MQQKLDKCAYNVASEGGKRNNNFPLIIIHSYSRMGVQRQQCLATFSASCSVPSQVRKDVTFF